MNLISIHSSLHKFTFWKHAVEGGPRMSSCGAFPFVISGLILSVVPCTLSVAAQMRPDGPVDTLDYMLQRDDTDESWRIGDTDVRKGRDPDGSDIPTFVLTKFGNPRVYEVYKITQHEIQLRYAASSPRYSPEAPCVVFRYDGIGNDGDAPGECWLRRIMTPGGTGFSMRYRMDRFVLNRQTHIGETLKEGSLKESEQYVSIAWVTNPKGEKCLFEGRPVIRRLAEWAADGSVFEGYDYAYRNGLVGWQWYQRLSTLQPDQGDSTKRIFHCENGYVFVESPGSAKRAPIVYQYDSQNQTKGKSLRVIQFKSHRSPAKGLQWYVIYRDSGDDYSLLRRDPGYTDYDFTLPEWGEKPGATIADIPCLYTHVSKRLKKPTPKR